MSAFRLYREDDETIIATLSGVGADDRMARVYCMIYKDELPRLIGLRFWRTKKRRMEEQLEQFLLENEGMA